MRRKIVDRSETLADCFGTPDSKIGWVGCASQEEINSLINARITVSDFVYDDYTRRQFEQYKLVIEFLTGVISRRGDNTKLYMPLNYSLVAAASYFIKSAPISEKVSIAIGFYAVSIAMVAIWWWSNQRSIQTSNSLGRLLVVYEEIFPTRPFTDVIFRVAKARRKSISQAESIIPLLFGAVYTLAVIIQLFWYMF